MTGPAFTGAQPAGHRARIAEALRWLEWSPADLREYRVLRGGNSGSIVYRIRHAARDLVLKITTEDAEPQLLRRAHREAAFYRDLAPHLPLRVPRLLASSIAATGAADDDGAAHGPSGSSGASRANRANGVALVLEAYEPSPPPNRWREADYLEATEQLGRFHAAFWNAVARLDGLPWLRRAPSIPETGRRDSEGGAERALATWRAIRAREPLRGVLTARRYRLVLDAVAGAARAREVLRAWPRTLCHGDCHMGNVLKDAAGSLVWADWQAVGVGVGPEDLSFFCQRAGFAGGDVPWASVLDTYRATVVGATGEHLDPQALQCAMDAAELRSILFDWPPYLREGSAAQLTYALDRIQQTAARLRIAT